MLCDPALGGAGGYCPCERPSHVLKLHRYIDVIQVHEHGEISYAHSISHYNPPGKHYTHLVRKKPVDSACDVDFYYGPRYIGGKEGPWGNSDFLFTTLGNNTYKHDPADNWYGPDYPFGNELTHGGRPIDNWLHY